MKNLKLIGALTAIVVILTFMLQNTQPVETRFLFIKIMMPNAVLIGITLLIGIGVGILISLTGSTKRLKKR